MGKYFIIGAGLSGLRIGQLLATEGKSIEIFESAGEIGGLMRTEKRNGFLFDIGPHIFFEDYTDEYKRLIANDLHNSKGLYGIAFNGRDIISPIRPSNLIKNLGIKKSLPLMRGVLQRKLGNLRAEAKSIDNAEKWVISNFGNEVYRYFFKDYIPKVMGLAANRVTEEWGTERHKFYKEHNLWQKSLKFFLDFLVNKQNHGGYLNIYYPEHGARQVTDAMGEEILKHGGKIHLNTSVAELDVRDQRIDAVFINRNGVPERISMADGDVVISTMPITDLINSLISTNTNIDDCRNFSKALRYRNLWLFNFIIQRHRLKDKVQIYFPEAKYIFKRVYEPKNLVPSSVNTGKTALCAEVCFDIGDEIDSMDESAATSQVVAGLMDFYDLSEAEILDVWSKKVPFAYSVYEIGYKQKLHHLAEFIFDIDNLISFGRQGSFRYNHMTNRVMDACNRVYNFLASGQTKREFLINSDPKADFF